MSVDETAFTLGAHQADIAQLKADMAAMRSDMKEIKETLLQAKGGWRMLMAVGGLGSALGAVGGWIASHVLPKVH